MANLPRRIIKETQRLLQVKAKFDFDNSKTRRPETYIYQEPVPGIVAVPDESNARYFHVVSPLFLFLDQFSELLVTYLFFGRR